MKNSKVPGVPLTVIVPAEGRRWLKMRSAETGVSQAAIVGAWLVAQAKRAEKRVAK